MKFDSNLAWQQAAALVSANRDLLLALAGVFFLLPSLAVGLLLPQPEPASGMSQQQMMDVMSAYYVSALPYVIPMALLQAAGTLAMLTLFTDRTRPTVGQAIRIGLAGIVPYILSQLLVGLGIGLVGGVLVGIAAATGAKALAGVAVALLLVVVIHAMIKTSLSAPVIAVEGLRNPVEILRRSWRLTTGNSARLGLFYLLVGIAFLIVSMLVMGVIGVVLALLGGAETVRVVTTVASSALGAVMTLYFVAVLAAVHRQLAGPSPDAASAPFE